MRNSVKRLSGTTIMSLLVESSVSPNKNKIWRVLLEIGQRIWKETDQKNEHSAMRYKISCWRVILWSLIVVSVLFVCRFSDVGNNGSQLRYMLYLAFPILILTFCLVVIMASPEDTFEQKLLLLFMTLFIRWLTPVILIVILLILFLAYSSNYFLLGLFFFLYLSFSLGLLHIFQKDVWLSVPLVRYSRYLKPEKLDSLLWVAAIIFCYAAIQNKTTLNIPTGMNKYLMLVVTVLSYIVGECVTCAYDRWNGGVDLIDGIIENAGAIILDMSNKVVLESTKLIEDVINLDGQLSEDVLHRRRQKNIIASDELRMFLLLYVGRIVSNDITFCENRSRKVIIPGSSLLSANADMILRSMSNSVYEDTKKKGRKILEKTQEQCMKELCEFLFALREHLIEERRSM